MATFTADLAALETPVEPGNEPIEQPGTEPISEPGAQPGSEPQLDGRVGPRNYRNAAKLAAEALPEHAATIKEMADKAYTLAAHQQAFKTPQEATSAKELFDAVGGIDGVTQLQQRKQSYDAQDEGLKSGNPEVLDAAFKDFPEGMATLAPHYLDKLAKSNPEAFEATIAPHAMGMLDRAGIPSHIAQMMQETDPARLKNMVGQLDAWIKKNSETVKTMRPAAAQPQDGKFKEQQTKLQQDQEEFFGKQVDAAVNTASAPELSKIVDQYAKTYKLNDVQKARFGTSLATRIVQEMLADDTFKKQDQLRRNSKDVEKVSSFRATEFQRRLSDAAFKEAQELYGATQRPQNGTGEVKPGGPKAAPGGGPLMVSRALDTADLDMSKDPNGYLFIANKGYRKADGAFVTWR